MMQDYTNDTNKLINDNNIFITYLKSPAGQAEST
jgi:hypothetical protein